MIKCPKCSTEYEGAERFCPKDGTRLGSTGEGAAVKMPSVAPGKDPLIGKVIQGRYRVIEQIGEGGMGVVYIAEHVEIEKRVALKVLRDDFSKRPEVVARFRQEARSASKIGSEHIVDVTDFGQIENGSVYFVMEYLPGYGLSEVIKREPISLTRALAVVLQIAKALNAAHKLGIVHRDLKPENVILIEKEGKKDFVKILDFGIAKISDRDSEGQRLTKTGMIFGTPEYMSPEQAAGKPLDHRVDIYALGCIMFEMFTGRVPFEGETFMAVLTQHMFEPVPKIEEIKKEVEVPEAVKQMVYKAMAKDREDRYSDMTELADELEHYLGEIGYENGITETITGIDIIQRKTKERENGKTEMSWGKRTQRLERRRDGRAGVIIGIITVITLMVGGGAVYYKENILEAIKGKGSVEKEERRIQAQRKLVTENIQERKKDNEFKVKNIEEKSKDTLPPKVEVTVNTEPKGAVVSISGMGQVCSKTPCKINMEEGKSVEIEASSGERKEKQIFTPSKQNKDVKIVIKNVKEEGNRKYRKKEHKKEGEKEKTKSQDGLKIPDFFKNN